MFSDVPWGDMCAADPADDWSRIEKSKNITDKDLDFMTDLFQLDNTHFQGFLKTGPEMVWKFMKSTGLPEMFMLCDWQFYYPDVGNNKCMLWNEYQRLVD